MTEIDPGRLALAVHQAVAAVAPIVGVRIGDPADRTTWAIDFAPAATAAAKQAAQNALKSFDTASLNRQPTPEEKIAALGITVNELRALIGK